MEVLFSIESENGKILNFNDDSSISCDDFILKEGMISEDGGVT